MDVLMIRYQSLDQSIVLAGIWWRSWQVPVSCAPEEAFGLVLGIWRMPQFDLNLARIFNFAQEASVFVANISLVFSLLKVAQSDPEIAANVPLQNGAHEMSVARIVSQPR